MKLTASYIKKLIKEEYSSILVEGRIEDLKARYPADRVDALAALEINKTTNNKYLEWMLGRGGDTDPDELEKAVTLFNKNTGRLADKGLPADINSYKSVQDLNNQLAGLGMSKGERDVTAREQTIFHDIGDDLACFLTPTTTLASQKYGKSTTWCIAAREEEHNLFDFYSDDKDSVFYFYYKKDYKPPAGLKKASDFGGVEGPEFAAYIQSMKDSGADLNKFAIQVMSLAYALDQEYIDEQDVNDAWEPDNRKDVILKCTTVFNAINDEIGLSGFQTAVGKKRYNEIINFIVNKQSKAIDRYFKVEEAENYIDSLISDLQFDMGSRDKSTAEHFKQAMAALIKLNEPRIYNKLLKTAKKLIQPKFREASGVDQMEMLPAETTRDYSYLRENKMKLTKSYIKQVIMEELGRLGEAVQSSALDVARKKIAQSQYDNLSDSEALTAASRDSEIRNAIAQNKNLSPEEIAALEKERGFDKNNPLAVKMANSSKIKTPAIPGSEEEKFRQSLRLATK